MARALSVFCNGLVLSRSAAFLTARSVCMEQNRHRLCQIMISMCCIRTRRVHTSFHVSKKEEPFGDKLLRFVGWLGGFYSRKQVLYRSMRKLYDESTSTIDYNSFYATCNLPDTFQSWFLVTQLHVWMCIVQLDRLDQKDAAVAKRLLADIFWFDVDDRVRALGSTSSTVRARGKRELIEQFYGLSFAYTEGAAKDDCVLASALWRNLVADKSTTDPFVLEVLVKYVRMQLNSLSRVPLQRLREKGEVTWCPLELKL